MDKMEKRMYASKKNMGFQFFIGLLSKYSLPYRTISYYVN